MHLYSNSYCIGYSSIASSNVVAPLHKYTSNSSSISYYIWSTITTSATHSKTSLSQIYSPPQNNSLFMFPLKPLLHYSLYIYSNALLNLVINSTNKINLTLTLLYLLLILINPIAGIPKYKELLKLLIHLKILN